MQTQYDYDVSFSAARSAQPEPQRLNPGSVEPEGLGDWSLLVFMWSIMLIVILVLLGTNDPRYVTMVQVVADLPYKSHGIYPPSIVTKTTKLGPFYH